MYLSFKVSPASIPNSCLPFASTRSCKALPRIGVPRALHDPRRVLLFWIFYHLGSRCLCRCSDGTTPARYSSRFFSSSMTLGSFTDPLLFLLLLLLLPGCCATAAAVLLLLLHAAAATFSTRWPSRTKSRFSPHWVHRTPDQQEGPDQGGSASRWALDHWPASLIIFLQKNQNRKNRIFKTAFFWSMRFYMVLKTAFKTALIFPCGFKTAFHFPCGFSGFAVLKPHAVPITTDC